MSKIKMHEKDMAYRIYVTDSLWASGEGKRITRRYYDIIKPKPVDSRSGDEIAKDIIERFNLKLGSTEVDG